MKIDKNVNYVFKQGVISTFRKSSNESEFNPEETSAKVCKSLAELQRKLRIIIEQYLTYIDKFNEAVLEILADLNFFEGEKVKGKTGLLLKSLSYILINCEGLLIKYWFDLNGWHIRIYKATQEQTDFLNILITTEYEEEILDG